MASSLALIALIKNPITIIIKSNNNNNNKKGIIMVYKNLACRNTIKETLEYIFRESDAHNHKMQDVRFLMGTSISDSPLLLNKENQIEDVDVSELAEEFEFQKNLYQGRSKNGNLYDHAVLSLAPSETLSEEQWKKAAEKLQEKLDLKLKDSLWCGAIHLETDSMHVHIVSCRVTTSGKLVSMHNNYVKAQEVCRELEGEFGLTVVVSSDKKIGNEDMTREEYFKSLNKNGDIKDVDVRKVIRQQIAHVFKHCKPKTISEFAEALDERGIDIKARQGAIGEVKGVLYRVKSLKDKWYAGSSVSSTHASFGSLIRSDRKNLSYEPSRDNPSLGLAPIFKMKVKITKKQLTKIKQYRLNAIVRKMDKEVWVDFSFCKSKKDQNMLKLNAAIMNLLSMLFGSKADLFQQAQQLNNEISIDVASAEYLALSETVYETDITVVYNCDDIQACAMNIDRDTRTWRGSDEISRIERLLEH